MSDISKCTNQDCPMHLRCKRYTTEAKKKFQYYIDAKPEKGKNKCELFIDNKYENGKL